jgi:hypothetical protein
MNEATRYEHLTNWEIAEFFDHFTSSGWMLAMATNGQSGHWTLVLTHSKTGEKLVVARQETFWGALRAIQARFMRLEPSKKEIAGGEHCYPSISWKGSAVAFAADIFLAVPNDKNAQAVLDALDELLARKGE